MAYKVIDLFAGAGGLSLGFMQTGRFEIVAAAENNPGARKTYKRNHKLARLYPDVRTIDYTELEESCGEIDVVIGGPPCQGFSNANRQHTTIISMNNRLVKEYVRAVRELEPKAFLQYLGHSAAYYDNYCTKKQCFPRYPKKHQKKHGSLVGSGDEVLCKESHLFF